uniref:Uncharacterized protein n=1 Tax=Oncorhynchus mykiss TaxID=8022 RepID=A0A8C7P9J2_ONCMY
IRVFTFVFAGGRPSSYFLFLCEKDANFATNKKTLKPKEAIVLASVSSPRWLSAQ